jgi:hypothetical protein
METIPRSSTFPPCLWVKWAMIPWREPKHGRKNN